MLLAMEGDGKQDDTTWVSLHHSVRPWFNIPDRHYLPPTGMDCSSNFELGNEKFHPLIKI
jgi:hypothetical protein